MAMLFSRVSSMFTFVYFKAYCLLIVLKMSISKEIVWTAQGNPGFISTFAWSLPTHHRMDKGGTSWWRSLWSRRPTAAPRPQPTRTNRTELVFQRIHTNYYEHHRTREHYLASSQLSHQMWCLRYPKCPNLSIVGNQLVPSIWKSSVRKWAPIQFSRSRI